MKFSENVRSLRQGLGKTQEQLAECLGVCAQAVSKWECGESYPDGELLVPLADALGVSLDALFGREEVYLPDTARRIAHQIAKAPAEQHFSLLRTLCWQMERGMFGMLPSDAVLEDPKDRPLSSYILRDGGFTHVANGDAPFFLLCPEPEGGWEGKLGSEEALCAVFSALGDRDTLKMILFLHRQESRFLFEAEILLNRCGILPENLGKVLENGKRLGLICEQQTVIDRQARTLYTAAPSHKIIALLLLAKEMDYNGGYCLQADNRTLPLLR